MSMRPKTKRRLLILVIVLLAVVGLGTGGYAFRRHQIAQQNLLIRDEGLAAFARQDYGTALAKLSKFNFTKDAPEANLPALFAYGKSRKMEETPDGRRYLTEAKDVLRKYLELDPDHTEAQRELLDVYRKLNYDSESIPLADKLLAKDPNDVAALRRKAEALRSQHKYEEALPLSLKVNDMTPTDLTAQRLTYVLMHELKKPPQEVLARAQKMHDDHAADPRFDLLMGVAHMYASDLKSDPSGTELREGLKWLRSAAAKPAPDVEFVRQLAEIFTQMGLFDDFQKLLEGSSAQASDVNLQRQLAQVLWQNGKLADLVERFKNLDPASKSSHAQLLGLKALSLYQLGKNEDADAIAKALSGREDDSRAMAWGAVLRARYARPALSTRALVDQLQAAQKRDGSNGIISYMLGEAYLQLGESELAMQNWRRAGELLPTWSRPHLLLSRLLMVANRSADALEEARAAYRLSPNQASAAATLVDAWSRRLKDAPDAKQEKSLLEFVTWIQTSLPGEPETLPIYVNLLVRADKREQAISAIQAAIDPAKQISGETLTRLSAISAAEHLGLEQAISERLNAATMQSPAMAYRNAAALAAQGKVDEGLKSLKNAAAGATADSNTWKLAILSYRELINDAGVAADWIDLGEKNPGDLQIQKTILREATSSWSDRSFIDRTIERVKVLTGEEGLDWRIARARQLLSSAGDDKDRQKDAAAASVILSDIVRASPNLAEPRILWAKALQQLNNLTGALEQLRSAADLKPGDLSITFDLVRLMRQQGKTAETTTLLERLAASPALTLEGRKRVAAMFSETGLGHRAIDLLTSNPEDAANIGRNTMLADLYRRQGKIDEADKIYRTLLADPGINASAIQAAAEFYASRKDSETARKFLKRLDELKLRAGLNEQILGVYNERFGTLDRAGELFGSAVKLAPTDPSAWKSLIGYELRRGKYKEALAAADEGLKNVPGDESLQMLRRQADTILSTAGSSDLGPLIETLSIDPKNEAVVQTLTALRDARKAGASPAEIANKLRQVADKFPQSMPVQLLVARAYGAIGRLQEATAITSRAMEAFPNDSDPARLLVSILSTAGRWEQMKVAAQQWRMRTLDNTLQADLAIAEAQIRTGDGRAALNTLSAWIPAAKSDPNANFLLAAAFSKAMIVSGKSRDASEFLLPLAQSTIKWREVWLDIATLHNNAADAKKWLEQITSSIPAENLSEQNTLAATWYAAAQRYNDPTMLDLAGDLLKKLTADPKATASQWLLLASIHEFKGNYAQAEAGYRQALKRDPKNAVAQNNLAYILLLSGGDLPEALGLSQQAVTSPLAMASFHDTLARIYSKMGNKDDAMQSFNNALAMDPNSLEAMIGLADIQFVTGKRSEAERNLKQIDTLLKTKVTLPSVLQKQLQDLRQNLSSVQ